MEVHHDIMDGRYSAPPFNGRPSALGVARRARRGRGRDHRPVLRRRRGGRSRRGRASCPTRSSASRPTSRKGPSIDGSIIWPNGWIGPDAHVKGSILGPQLPRRPQRHHRVPRGPRRQDRHHRLQQTMIDPHIFKAYDVRGLYPQEVNEDAARLIGRGFVAYLGAKRIAVSRDMRLSSPSMAAAFIEGARLQGADVVDYGMMGTDMLYFAVARDGHDGGVQITASHNPKEYNGIKMVRKEAFPLSRRVGHRRHPRHDRGGQAPAAGRDEGRPHHQRRRRRLRHARDVVHRPRRSSSRSTSCSTPAAAWPAWSRRSSSSTSRPGR